MWRWHIIVALIGLFSVLWTPVRSEQQLVQLSKENFLIGIAAVGAYYENSSSLCGRELEYLKQAALKQELWTLKLMDSFGLPPKQFIWGNYFWMGTPDMCHDLNQPFTINLAYSQPLVMNATSPFPLRFTVIYLNFTTPLYIDLHLIFQNVIHLGLCLPQSCSLDKLRYYTDKYFENQQEFEMQRNYDLVLRTVGIKAPRFLWTFFTQTGTVLCCLVIFTSLSLMVLAEIVSRTATADTKLKDFFQRRLWTQQSPRSPSPKLVSTTNAFEKLNNKNSLIVEYLLCFRLKAILNSLWSLDVGNGRNNGKTFTCMSGMRSIICLWITVFHVYYYSMYALSNGPLMIAKLEYFAFQPVAQACFYVDVFFIMSAFLLVYNFLMNTHQMDAILHNNWKGNLNIFLRSIFQRYMRLTPVLICTMILSCAFYDLLDMYTPFHFDESSEIYCKNNWWYNLLYIQNLLDMNKICCSWTWYLACEMQYFILFTGLLFVHVKHPKLGKILFGLLTVAFVIISWMCNYRYGTTFQIDVIYGTINQVYNKPWMRIIPYEGGAIMGWLMYRMHQKSLQQHQHTVHQTSNGSNGNQEQNQQQQQQQQQHWNRFLYYTFWLLCAVLYVFTNFMSYWRSTPIWLVASIMSLGKFIFAFSIGGVIIMCANGRGGHLNTMLSSRIFLFFNKFCFSVYMLAPLIVVTMFGLRNEPTNFTEVGSGADFFGVIVTSIMGAVVMLVLIEIPMQRVTNLLMHDRRRSSS